MTDDDLAARVLAAHHEAGHAVAACMRGSSRLTAATLGAVHGQGLTTHHSKPTDGGFIAWAGPWAEARSGWPEGLPLDVEDEDGTTFPDHIVGVLLAQPDDAQIVRQHWQEIRSLGIEPSDGVWLREMEAVLPVVRVVAERLLRGEEVTHGDVIALLEKAG